MPSDTGPATDPTILTDPTLTDHAARNRSMWDDYSDEYQAEHGDELAARGGLRLGNDARYPNPSCASSATSSVATSSNSVAAPRNGRSRWPSSAPARLGWTCRNDSSSTLAG